MKRRDGSSNWPAVFVGSLVFLFALSVSGALADAPEIEWGTFLGDSGYDDDMAAVSGVSGDTYVVVWAGDEVFPTPNGVDTTLDGEHDLYIARIADDGQLAWGTYLGGSGVECMRGSHVDGDGNLLLIGTTTSTDFPTVNAFDTALAGTKDFFVAKITPAGEIAWASYLGGSDDDAVVMSAVDSAGNLYAVGLTDSTDFPTPNGFDTTPSADNLFLFKVTSAGQLAWGTYIADNRDVGWDSGTVRIIPDGSGNLYLTMIARNGDYWTSDSGYVRVDQADLYVMKFAGSGEVSWARLLGGSDFEGVWDHVSSYRWPYSFVDADGNLLVAGCTYSDDFPAVNAFDDTLGGYYDSFVAKFTPAGDVAWASYLGGSDDDYVMGSVIDGDGNMLVLGVTRSQDFPTPDGFDTTHSGHNISNFFLVKVASDGQLEWGSFLNDNSATGLDYRNIVAGPDGSAYVMFQVDLRGNPPPNPILPTPNGFDTTVDGQIDLYVARITPDGQLAWGDYLGKSGWEWGWGIIPRDDLKVVIVGKTSSSDFPTDGGFDTTLGGDKDEFLTCIGPDGELEWSTYLGGSGLESAMYTLPDGAGKLAIVGLTSSGDFPTPNGFDTAYAGGMDIFALKIAVNEEESFRCIGPADGALADAGSAPLFEYEALGTLKPVWIEFSTSVDFPPRAAQRPDGQYDRSAKFAAKGGLNQWTFALSQWKLMKKYVTSDYKLYWRLAGKRANGEIVYGPTRTLVFETGEITGLTVLGNHLLEGDEAIWPEKSAVPTFQWTDATVGMKYFWLDVSKENVFDLKDKKGTLTFCGSGITGDSYTLKASEWKRLRKLAASTGGAVYWRVRAKDQDKALTCASGGQKLVIDGGEWTVSDLDLGAASPAVSWTRAGEGIVRFTVEFSADGEFDAGPGSIAFLPVKAGESERALASGEVKRIKALAARAGSPLVYYRVRGEDADKAFRTYSEVKSANAP